MAGLQPGKNLGYLPLSFCQDPYFFKPIFVSDFSIFGTFAATFIILIACAPQKKTFNSLYSCSAGHVL
jgi:hypothetical protein